MASTLYLLNGDEPSQFRARTITVVREKVRIGEQTGVVVRIEPPLDREWDSLLSEALIVPRHRDVNIDEIRNGFVTRPANVFVCRFTNPAARDSDEVTTSDVSIVFWGLVINAADVKR